MFANAMEVFKLLNKSNCRKCNETTCLAFASKVFLGQRKLSECPELVHKLDPKSNTGIKAQFSSGNQKPDIGKSEYEQDIAAMKKHLKTMNFEDAAQRTHGKYINGDLEIRLFGKPLYIDKKGHLKSDIHINPWIEGPVLTYVLNSKGLPLSNEWMPFRELDARELNGLFVKRVSDPLKKIADTHPDLFEDLAMIFNGKKMKELYNSDISMVLYPLPLIPVLICYWKNEDDMGSDMHLFFDKTASDNGGGDMVFRLTAGVVRMFEKLTITHGWQSAGQV